MTGSDYNPQADPVDPPPANTNYQTPATPAHVPGYDTVYGDYYDSRTGQFYDAQSKEIVGGDRTMIDAEARDAENTPRDRAGDH